MTMVPSPAPTAPAGPTFSTVVDGDTINTSEGLVRIIGIDTPENGECGSKEASAVLAALLKAGDTIVLTLPKGQNDTDTHKRLLRYVDTAAGVDVAMEVLKAGLAVARYDSADGYPAHPREAEYRAAQTATLTAEGVVMSATCQAEADAAAAAAAEAQAAAEAAAAEAAAAEAAEAERIAQEQAAAAERRAAAWWTQYSSCSKLKKNTNGHPTGPFARDDPNDAEIYNWFAYGTGNRGDGDNDGLACE